MLRRLNTPNGYNAKWITYVKQNLDGRGFSNMWHLYSGTDPVEHGYFTTQWFKNSIKLRGSDMYLQIWNECVWNHRSCVNYRIFKNELKLENYLHVLNYADAVKLCRFRCRNSNIPVARNTSDNPEDLICTICNSNEVGDEYHYLFKCKKFSEERMLYIAKYYRNYPNTQKMHELFTSKSRKTLKNLVRFIDVVNSAM